MLITQLKAKEAITSLTAGKKTFSLLTVMDVKRFISGKRSC